MRPTYCVVVRHGDGRLLAVGRGFVSERSAASYAATLPAGIVVGVAQMLSTDMYRVESGNGVVNRRQPGAFGRRD